MDGTRVHRGHGRGGGRGPEMAVDAVAGLEHPLLALRYLENGRDVGMPPVVPGSGLLDEPLRAIDLDALHDDASVLRNARQRSSACAKPGPRSIRGRSRARGARSSLGAVLSTSWVTAAPTTPQSSTAPGGELKHLPTPAL